MLAAAHASANFAGGGRAPWKEHPLPAPGRMRSQYPIFHIVHLGNTGTWKLRLWNPAALSTHRNSPCAAHTPIAKPIPVLCQPGRRTRNPSGMQTRSASASAPCHPPLLRELGRGGQTSAHWQRPILNVRQQHVVDFPLFGNLTGYFKMCRNVGHFLLCYRIFTKGQELFLNIFGWGFQGVR